MKNTRLKLIKEIKRLNESLEKISNSSRYMVYSARPAKFFFYNFFGGIASALGYLFGTAIIAGLIVYVLNQIHFSLFDSLTQLIQNVLPTPTP